MCFNYLFAWFRKAAFRAHPEHPAQLGSCQSLNPWKSNSSLKEILTAHPAETDKTGALQLS